MTLRNLIRQLRRPSWKKSYAQSGEDLIVAFLLNFTLQIPKPTYLDIGAHHPFDLSNTYYFYRMGCSGVCVEPNPILHKLIQENRPNDTCLNIGIGATDSDSTEFYVINPPTMSTFSKAELESYAAKGYKVEATLQIPLLRSSTVIDKYLSGTPNFVSIDTEGYDMAVLEAWDFQRHRPEVFSVETVTHDTGTKSSAIPELFAKNGYRVYADTFINTIFVEGDAFARRIS